SNVSPTTTIDTLSLHDALPIFATSSEKRLIDRKCSAKNSPTCFRSSSLLFRKWRMPFSISSTKGSGFKYSVFNAWTFLSSSLLRSEEHTSELQSRENLVCRLLL